MYIALVGLLHNTIPFPRPHTHVNHTTYKRTHAHAHCGPISCVLSLLCRVRNDNTGVGRWQSVCHYPYQSGTEYFDLILTVMSFVPIVHIARANEPVSVFILIQVAQTQQDSTRLYLLYSNRTRDNTACHDELLQIARNCPDQFHLTLVLTSATGGT